MVMYLFGSREGTGHETLWCGSVTLRYQEDDEAHELQTAPGETSRTVIRAASLRLLPDVHARSIYQLFSLEP